MAHLRAPAASPSGGSKPVVGGGSGLHKPHGSALLASSRRSLIDDIRVGLSFSINPSASNSLIRLPGTTRGSFMPTLSSGHAGLDKTGEEDLMDRLPPSVEAMGWILNDKIGEGGFSKVYKAHKRMDKSGHVYAAKVITISEKNQDWWASCLKRELKISQLLQHRNVIKIYDVVKTTRHGFIFMNYSPNGSVKDFLQKEHDLEKKAGKLRDLAPGAGHEKLIAKWFAQFAAALEYIHGKQVAHRDIKLDNFLLDAEFNATLTDFGFACFTRRDGKKRKNLPVFANTHCGTQGYLAPEVAYPPYDATRTDCWALGICLFELFTMKKPFHGRITDKQAWRKMWESKAKPEYLNELPRVVDPTVKILLKGLLDPVDETRYTATQCLAHPWVQKGTRLGGGGGWNLKRILSLGLVS